MLRFFEKKLQNFSFEEIDCFSKYYSAFFLKTNLTTCMIFHTGLQKICGAI